MSVINVSVSINQESTKEIRLMTAGTIFVQDGFVYMKVWNDDQDRAVLLKKPDLQEQGTHRKSMMYQVCGFNAEEYGRVAEVANLTIIF